MVHRRNAIASLPLLLLASLAHADETNGLTALMPDNFVETVRTIKPSELGRLANDIDPNIPWIGPSLSNLWSTDPGTATRLLLSTKDDGKRKALLSYYLKGRTKGMVQLFRNHPELVPILLEMDALNVEIYRNPALYPLLYQKRPAEATDFLGKTLPRHSSDFQRKLLRIATAQDPKHAVDAVKGQTAQGQKRLVGMAFITDPELYRRLASNGLTIDEQDVLEVLREQFVAKDLAGTDHSGPAIAARRLELVRKALDRPTLAQAIVELLSSNRLEDTRPSLLASLFVRDPGAFQKLLALSPNREAWTTETFIALSRKKQAPHLLKKFVAQFPTVPAQVEIDKGTLNQRFHFIAEKHPRLFDEILQSQDDLKAHEILSSIKTDVSKNLVKRKANKIFKGMTYDERKLFVAQHEKRKSIKPRR